MNIKSLLRIVCLAFAAQTSLAQESEQPLNCNPVQAQLAALERTFSPRSVDRTSLTLPFFDDFSRFSFPTNNPEIPVDWQRWEQNGAFLNNDFPVNPVTVGVATLDGLNANGYPYDFLDEFTYGPADTLTSLPVNLGGLDQTDNVYLSFFFQAQGIGNAPDDDDSLLVEFYAPATEAWIHVWSIPGQSSAPFEQVFIPVDQTYFLLDGFQFRFRNYATLAGNVDHWHLDYVRLNSQVDPQNAPINDVAFTYNVNSLLNPYTAMPWTHFVSNPVSFMAQSVEFYLANRSPGPQNVPTSYQAKYDDLSWTLPNVDINTSFFPGEYTGTAPINSNPTNFVFDTTVNDTCAVFDICFYINNQDPFAVNDTIRFQQKFLDYYAYDDGTAELAYGLSSAGAQLAIKYNSVIPDQLLGLLIYFNPFLDDVSENTFVLRAWTDEGGSPGAELGVNFAQHEPQYLQQGHNVFAYYAYDNPIDVSGNFFVGIVQNGPEKLNIGNDKNGSTNLSTVKFRLATSGAWNGTTIDGSLMIRPVFRAGKTVISDIKESNADRVLVYPNPSSDSFSFVGIGNATDIRIADLSGKTVHFETIRNVSNFAISANDWPKGMYVASIRMIDGTVKNIKLNRD